MSSEPEQSQFHLEEYNRGWVVGSVVCVIMSHVKSPHLMTANVVDDQTDLQELMEEMTKTYTNSKPLKFNSKNELQKLVGEYCVCYDNSDKIWFRANVVNWTSDKPTDPIFVWSVDFGGFVSVPPFWVRPLEGRLCKHCPAQATQFRLHNVRPRCPPLVTDWPEEHCKEIRKILKDGTIYFFRIEGKPAKDGIWPVSVYEDQSCQTTCLNDVIVEARLAFYRSALPEPDQPSAAFAMGRSDWNPMADDYLRGGRNWDVDDEDATYAITGHKQQQDYSICRYFAANGKCHKGLNCRQRHIRQRPDGYTQNKDYVYGKAFAELTLPNPGELISLRVTRVRNVHSFIAIIIPTKVTSTRENYSSLLAQMNKPNETSSFKSMTYAPAIGEVVIARNLIPDTKPQQYYYSRARVIDLDEDFFHLIDVDTGTQVWLHLNDLRQMEPAFLHLPFQAITCFLSGYSPVLKGAQFSKEGTRILTDLVKDKIVQAVVVNRTIENELELKVTFDSGEDLGLILERRGYIEKSSSRIDAAEIVKYIPG